MRIVVTNDDGIYSPGLQTLARAAQRLGEVRIVAPDVEMSSAGHSITSSRPLTYKPTSIPGFEAYRVNGTPADCVALGTYNWEKVDLILSGTNRGSNRGWKMMRLTCVSSLETTALRPTSLPVPAVVGMAATKGIA